MAEKDKKEIYIILTDNSEVGITQSARLLASQVNQKISEGYEPFGGLIVTSDQSGKNQSFFQPMVLRRQAPAAAAQKKPPEAPAAEKKAG